MSVRAKFTVSAITENAGYQQARHIKLQAMYDTSIPEDQRFSEATPSGSMEMWVNNPAAIEQLTLGKAFYLDLTPAD